MSVQQIISFNNAAASCLASGDASSSLKTLKKAMAAISEHEEAGDMEMDYSMESSMCSSVEITSMEDPSFYIFNRALLLDASTDMAFANAALLFNMALTVHQRGLQPGESDKLAKALRLYNLAIQLATTLGLRAGMLVTASLNNQASIHFSLGEYSSSQEYLKLVPDAANAALSAAQPQSLVDQAAMEEIFLNVSIIQTPTAAPCA